MYLSPPSSPPPSEPYHRSVLPQFCRRAKRETADETLHGGAVGISVVARPLLISIPHRRGDRQTVHAAREEEGHPESRENFATAATDRCKKVLHV